MTDKDTILLVDDDSYILKSLERLFDETEFRVLLASDAIEAMDILLHEEVPVIVSDNFMPGTKGIDLLCKVRALYPNVIRILMTGNADLSTAIDAINRGEVFRFITKPWDDNTFLKTVREGAYRYKLINNLKRADESTLLSLAQAIELKDRYTRGHCDRVGEYAVKIAAHLSLSEDEIKQIQFGSWLHDCGKIGVPEAILNKTSSLDEEEFDIIKKHPLWGADVARQAQLSETAVNIILHHHEKYWGDGYPAGLSGEEIPLEARIVAIADCFDAITSDRSYRKGFSIDKGIAIIHSMKEIHLDPEIVEIFIELLKDKRTVPVAVSGKVINNG